MRVIGSFGTGPLFWFNMKGTFKEKSSCSRHGSKLCRDYTKILTVIFLALERLRQIVD